MNLKSLHNQYVTVSYYLSTLSHHWLHERCHQSWYNSIQFNSIHFNSMTTHLLVHKMNFPRWKEGDLEREDTS